MCWGWQDLVLSLSSVASSGILFGPQFLHLQNADHDNGIYLTRPLSGNRDKHSVTDTQALQVTCTEHDAEQGEDDDDHVRKSSSPGSTTNCPSGCSSPLQRARGTAPPQQSWDDVMTQGTQHSLKWGGGVQKVFQSPISAAHPCAPLGSGWEDRLFYHRERAEGRAGPRD